MWVLIQILEAWSKTKTIKMANNAFFNAVWIKKESLQKYRLSLRFQNTVTGIF
jgi:hypothetical protein